MEYALFIAIAALLLAGFISLRALQRRVQMLEERLDGLAAQTGHDEYIMDYIDEKLQNELKQMKQNDRWCKRSNTCGKERAWIWCGPSSI
ncbi:hypothetical protein ACTQ34_00655 [Agathobaculum sp. LCP25S3_E8]|uniref:hypothetical protein n=1 Tax=Agathobaculum sp. LCP25S3_E8 TaxID=3438735 RepID=UPI003F92DEA8